VATAATQPAPQAAVCADCVESVFRLCATMAIVPLCVCVCVCVCMCCV